MFIKELVIEDKSGIIRKVPFHKGLNLIVDETPVFPSDDIDKNGITKTGNNVGKTTVLKLIDFCLGNDPKDIYLDNENKKEIKYIKEFLQSNNVVVTLILTEDLEDDNCKEIVIKRNFLLRNKKLMEINGYNYIGNSGQDFFDKLDELIIGERKSDKPTFREIISHNIRYSEQRISNTLKVLSSYTSEPEYETLHLYLFGVEQSERAPYISKIAVEKTYKARLEKPFDKNALEFKLSLIKEEIFKVEQKIQQLNINQNYETDLGLLNEVKYKITRISSEISKLTLRKKIIIEAIEDLKSQSAKINIQQLRIIYDQASQYVENLQKTFEELVEYHNKMIIEKVNFVGDEIPDIENEINNLNILLEQELEKEKDLSKKIVKSNTFKDLEDLIKKSNEVHQEMGEIENTINQIDQVEEIINDLEKDLKLIDEQQFSEEFQSQIKKQLTKFNKYFADVATKLYGETYAITFEVKEHKKSKRDVYVFHSFNANASSGKKQGEILCFDLAYIQFADIENIPVLHFILNDKKELMHGNQLINLNNYIKDKNIQVILSILSDKIPRELNTDDFVVLRLSQENKLFKIENR